MTVAKVMTEPVADLRRYSFYFHEGIDKFMLCSPREHHRVDEVTYFIPIKADPHCFNKTHTFESILASRNYRETVFKN